MVANLIQFATNHYILVAIFVVLLVALLVNEIRRGGQSLSNGQLTALVNAEKAWSSTSARPRNTPPVTSSVR